MNPDRWAQGYLRTNATLERAARAAKAVQDGLVLGLADHEVLYAIDRRFYAGKAQYVDDTYNRSGLWPWEQRVVEEHFQGCRRVLVTSAGGGREVLALRRQGLEADGFECNPDLARAADDLLVRDTGRPGVVLAERDGWPSLTGVYDGVVIGWGSFMHVQGRDRRVAFLQQARARVSAGAPLLISFFVLPPSHSYYRTVARVGSAVRRLQGRPAVEVGDSLVPNYCHAFDRASITAELDDAGFRLQEFHTEEYGHAVAVATGARPGQEDSDE